MNNQHYIALEKKIEKLIRLCEQFHKENALLLKKEREWEVERSELVRKKERAIEQLEKMVARLQEQERKA